MDPHKVEDSDAASYKFRRGRFWLTEDGKDIDYVDICEFSHATVNAM
jgi:hypothetical protein